MQRSGDRDPEKSRREETMDFTRRHTLAAGAGALAAAVNTASAGWEPSERYPDPAVKSLDPAFEKYRIALTGVERIAAGCRFNEGAVYFGDARCLLWSDIPNNRIMRWDEETGRVSVFRKPSKDRKSVGSGTSVFEDGW